MYAQCWLQERTSRTSCKFAAVAPQSVVLWRQTGRPIEKEVVVLPFFAWDDVKEKQRSATLFI